MSQSELIEAEPDNSGLSLEQLAALCAVEQQWLLCRIEEGLLSPSADADGNWRFTSAGLLRVRRIAALERDFDALPELAALVADMQEEIDALRRRLDRAGLQP